MSEFVLAGKKKNFTDLVGTHVTIQGKEICVARAGDTFYAFDDKCTHSDSRLSGGDIEDGELSCPLHGARFSIKTGEALTLPAVKPVQTYEVKIEGENVLVKV